MEKEIYSILKQRFPIAYLNKRLKDQQHHAAIEFDGGFRLFWENLDWMVPPLKFFLKYTRLLQKGFLNSINYNINIHEVTLKDLPKAFKGYTILHLSDLHIEGIYDHCDNLIKKIENLDYDLCVITGDLRFLTYGPCYETIVYMKKLIQGIHKNKPIIGILGNHDFIEMVPMLEQIGIKMLVNESMLLKRGPADIGIAGLDDSRYYHAANLSKALKDISKCPVKILLSHSQEMIDNAQKAGINFYLCGHTHGGQICLPGGFIIIRNNRCHKRYVTGSWEYRGMHGYTNKGIGGSCLPVRFNCAPEIVLHKFL